MKKRKWIKLITLCITIVSSFILFGTPHKIKADTYQYKFFVQDEPMTSDKVNRMIQFYANYQLHNLDTIDLSYNNLVIKLPNAITSINATDFFMSFIYDENLNQWQYLSVSYKIRGVNFTIKPAEIYLEDFTILTPTNITYNNENYDFGDYEYSIAMSVINHFFYNNNVLSIKAFNFSYFTYYDTYLLSDFNHENNMHFVTRPNNDSALIDNTNGAVIYTTRDIPFLTVWGDVGLVTNFAFWESGAIGMNNTTQDRDTSQAVDTFFSLIANIVTIPIYYLQSLFSFNVLGINVYVIIFSFIGIAILLWVIFRLKSK